MAAHEYAREEIPYHLRPLQLLENYRNQTGNGHQYGQILKKQTLCHGLFLMLAIQPSDLHENHAVSFYLSKDNAARSVRTQGES